MSYIETNLQPGEEIKYRANLHFFLFVQPTILLLIGAFLASAPKEISAMPHYAGLLILFFGVVSLLQRLLVKIGSAYAVTNKRVILKTSVISRRAVDLILAKCAYQTKHHGAYFQLRNNYGNYRRCYKFLPIYCQSAYFPA